MSVEAEGEIPTPEKVMEKAFELNRAPFQFSVPDSVDDIWSGSCNNEGVFGEYPTISMKFNGVNEKRVVHFDTGCPFTALSYEDLIEAGVLPENGLTIEGKRGAKEYEYISQPMNVKLIDQKTGFSRPVLFRIRAIKDWKNSPFAAPCPKYCDHFENGKRLSCKNRKFGLAGRNILSETELSIVLNGKSGVTSFQERND